MKLKHIRIHNFRSVLDADIEAHDYLLLVGANNAGKSTILNALRIFYDDMKWSTDDFPKIVTVDEESWIQLTFHLNNDEWEGLADKYKIGIFDQTLNVRRYFKSVDRTRIQTNQSNIYGVINGQIETDQFYGAKNVGTAKVGQVLYVPALTTTAEQTKMSGPSPLRNMLNFLLKKMVVKSLAYQAIRDAFDQLNNEAQGENGFLNAISTPINASISSWGIKFDLSVNPVEAEVISKSLINFAFVDSSIGNVGFELDQYGHGFQRSMIYELIRLAPTFKDEKKSNKKEFNPSFNLVLFEEPEVFLHPSQQENMAYHLRRLAAEDGQQVIITTHSATFVGKAAEQINQLVRVRRTNGVTHIHQPKNNQLDEIFGQGGELLNTLREFVDNAQVSDNKKKRAREMIIDPPTADIALQEECFRFQLWLDSDRSSLFFADKVLLVEGATEKALFNYLLANDWHDLSAQRIYIVDVLGKFNINRYMALMSAYGIPHGVMLDDDQAGKSHEFHGVINDLIETSTNNHTLSNPVKFPDCLESFLGLEVPKRDDKKPIEIMKAITMGRISTEKLQILRAEFCKALAIPEYMI